MIQFDNVWLYYNQPEKQRLIFRRHHQVDWVLRGISFAIKDGETVGIIGLNGSGKSTTAALMAGIYLPDKGHVSVSSETNLLAQGLGFKGNFTGRDNIYLSAMLMGIPKKNIEVKINQIIEFADLGDKINSPIKVYSSGMRSRLQFAVSMFFANGNLIIDEGLSDGGDLRFRNKAISKIKEITHSDKIIVIISHSFSLLVESCQRVMWIHQGKVISFGDPRNVIKKYQTFVNVLRKDKAIEII